MRLSFTCSKCMTQVTLESDALRHSIAHPLCPNCTFHKGREEARQAEQLLGRALGYPKYSDDPMNFPGATEEMGVCIGDHVLITLAQEAAGRIVDANCVSTYLREGVEPYLASQLVGLPQNASSLSLLDRLYRLSRTREHTIAQLQEVAAQAAKVTPPPVVDTIRLSVGWECNRDCSYCCNKLPGVKDSFVKKRLEEIDWSGYKTICITGGEPFLDCNADRTRMVVAYAKARGLYVVVNTNGSRLDANAAARLAAWGIDALNIGIHSLTPECPVALSFADTFVMGLYRRFKGSTVKIRFNVQDIHREKFKRILLNYRGLDPALEIRYWKMNECDRANEDRVFLEW